MQRKALKQVSVTHTGSRIELINAAKQGHTMDERKGQQLAVMDSSAANLMQVFSGDKTQLSDDFQSSEREIEPRRIGIERCVSIQLVSDEISN